MHFNQAREAFIQTGSFILQEAALYLENINQLTQDIRQLKKNNTNISAYRIHLNNVRLRVGRAQQTEQITIRTASVIEPAEESLREGFTHSTPADMPTVGGSDTTPCFNKEQEANTTTSPLKQALYALLSDLCAWHSIQLEHIIFQADDGVHQLTEDLCYKELLALLAKRVSLKELGLKPFSLSQTGAALVNFLHLHPHLEILQLEIVEENWKCWRVLVGVLTTRAKLQRLDLARSVLSTDGYCALTNLLDQNCRINLSLQAEPNDVSALKAFEILKKRLSEPGLERFKKDYLSQAKLLQIALEDLESKVDTSLERFNFLVTNEGQLAISDTEKEAWIKAINLFPTIYQNHKEYIKNEPALLQLYIDEPITDCSKTVGYVLLMKTLETENTCALQILLKKEINIFEIPKNEEEPFLVSILRTKSRLKTLVVEYIRDNPQLEKRALEYLSNYPHLIDPFKDFSIHTDQHALHLAKKDSPNDLFFTVNHVLSNFKRWCGPPKPGDKRRKEWAEIYLHLHKSLQVFRSDSEEVTYPALYQIQLILHNIKKCANETPLGRFNKTCLRETIITLTDQFDNQLEKITFHRQDKKDKIIQTQEEELKTLSQELLVAKNKNRDLEEEKAKADAKHAESEAKNAEMKATSAHMQQELERMRAQLDSLEKLLPVEHQLATEGRSKAPAFF